MRAAVHLSSEVEALDAGLADGKRALNPQPESLNP